MIKRLEDGLHHVHWNGQWSGFGAHTLAKAEVYLAKLQRGLVHFEPIRTRAHQGEFQPGYLNGATSRNRITTTN
jgi:hypothetical protein